ncbi:hypothetical protein QBC35DRAFT_480757 [Podospora australis]|uniref:Cytoplasmic tRNA 2-thiolation protein 2 n=1 Tax=Podospora australis TaxID=1536484 RepID=A0AAN7AMA0_9PEZI|nr:hypothetical protein QBC35DRAFT_480757 [Podospora australis]
MDSNPVPAVSPTQQQSIVKCKKCHTNEATLLSRAQLVCRNCFTKFITTKCVKQIGILGKETKPAPSREGTGPPSRKYLLGLSLGPSSTTLLHLLHENVEYQLAKGNNAPFDLIVVHISSSSSPEATILEKYQTRYPHFSFQTHPLSEALALPAINWQYILPSSSSAPQTLEELFTILPSNSQASRADITNLLTRHLLLSLAVSTNAQALLLGHSTTAIAELTLSEAAKGRGFSLPWQINDGLFNAGEDGEKKMLVFHPLRDILRKEIVTYTTLTSPPLTDLIPQDDPSFDSINGNGNGQKSVVSHKDLSIEEVMSRYFADVEENYPSVVANVARTAGKLVRLVSGNEDGKGEQGSCALCRMPMDGEGDERWRGELGPDETALTTTTTSTRPGGGKLCYGCERSTVG